MQRDPSLGRLVVSDSRQRVRGSARAVRAVRNTRVFQMETRVVADVGAGDSRSWDDAVHGVHSTRCMQYSVYVVVGVNS